jgi:hypothetical protein
MSVIDKETIDAVAITPDGVGVKLLISDHLKWTDEYEHLLILQEKINAYIIFLESGQYRDMYNDIDFKYGVIEIHFMYEPTEKAKQFLQTVQNQIAELGIKIEYGVSRGETSEDK